MSDLILGDDLRSVYDRATFKLANREYYDAVPLFRQLLDAEPGNLEVRLLLARAYYHSAQLRRAEAELRVLVERDPVEQYARLLLGRTLERQGRDEEAGPHLRLASALAGDFRRCEARGADGVSGPGARRLVSVRGRTPAGLSCWSDGFRH